MITVPLIAAQHHEDKTYWASAITDEGSEPFPRVAFKFEQSIYGDFVNATELRWPCSERKTKFVFLGIAETERGPIINKCRLTWNGRPESPVTYVGETLSMARGSLRWDPIK